MDTLSDDINSGIKRYKVGWPRLSLLCQDIYN